MHQDHVRDGMRVRYYPSYLSNKHHHGTVKGKPWQLGGGTWVVRLENMDPTYRDGKRSYVPAAAVAHIEAAQPAGEVAL